MPRTFTPKVITANDLFDGDVIYLSPDKAWTRHHHEAALFTDESTATAQLAAIQHPHVVGAYLADAKAGPNGPEPVHFREAFRTRGPSNYPHGKQEAAA